MFNDSLAPLLDSVEVTHSHKGICFSSGRSLKILEKGAISAKDLQISEIEILS
jgi:hypothetical protein